jgi:hypothetical protein
MSCQRRWTGGPHCDGPILVCEMGLCCADPWGQAPLPRWERELIWSGFHPGEKMVDGRMRWLCQFAQRVFAFADASNMGSLQN